MNKLKQQKGETLVETLVAMLIIVLTVAFLCTCVATAANINKQTKEADEEYRGDLLAAESRIGDYETEEVVVTYQSSGYNERVSIKVYGDADSDFISYDYNEVN